MPTVYQAVCRGCGHEGSVTSDGYRAAYCDTPPPANVRHWDDPHLGILAHPGESYCLEAIERHLAPEPVAGRWVSVERRYCRGCGHSFEVRRLIAPTQLGCRTLLAGLVLSVLSGVVFVFWAPWGWEPGCGTGLVVFFVGYTLVALNLGGVERWMFHIAQRRLEERHPDRVRRVNTPITCSKCGADDSRVPGQVRSPIPCDECGERAVVVRCVGKS